LLSLLPPVLAQTPQKILFPVDVQLLLRGPSSKHHCSVVCRSLPCNGRFTINHLTVIAQKQGYMPQFAISHNNWGHFLSIATGYGLDNWGSTLRRDKSSVSSSQGANPVTNEGTSRGVRRPQNEADHSLQSSTEVNNGEAISLLICASSWLVLN
jgi:hypothetical protein